MNTPILLTLLRMLAIPIFVVAFYLPYSWAHWLAVAIYVLATFTDWLDGYLARNLHQETRFGAFLDPVADKLLVVVVLVLIVAQEGIAYLAIPAAVIIGREIVVSALREWMAEIGKRTSVAVSYIGKVKTMAQMLALLLLLLSTPKAVDTLAVVGAILLYVAAILTLWSMLIYLKAAWPDLTHSTKTP